MLILLALPVIVAVAAMHRFVAVFAPTNVLVRRARTQEPRWEASAVLAVFAVGLLVIMHLVAVALANGAPGWLNLVVVLLAWDAIKLGQVAALQACRSIARRWRYGPSLSANSS
jgi:hypothetical protein